MQEGEGGGEAGRGGEGGEGREAEVARKRGRGRGEESGSIEETAIAAVMTPLGCGHVGGSNTTDQPGSGPVVK